MSVFVPSKESKEHCKHCGDLMGNHYITRLLLQGSAGDIQYKCPDGEMFIGRWEGTWPERTLDDSDV